MVFVYYGYACGLAAPGVDDWYSMLPAAHNVIRAHARAWHSYNSDFRPSQSGLHTFYGSGFQPGVRGT